MKKIIYLAMLFGFIIFSACKKSNPGNGLSNNKTIRYDFKATMAGNYSFQTITDSVSFAETVNTASWSKTVYAVDNIQEPDSAIFTVFPPADWVGTSNQAHVKLSIFINNVEKASDSALFTGLDRPSGVTIAAAY